MEYRELEEDVVQDLVSFVQETTYENIPTSTINYVKRLMLDTLGAILCGSEAEGCTELTRLITGWGGTPEATIIGSGQKVPALNAALVNATMARAMEVDDVHESALLHGTATIVPAALATSEQIGGCNGKRFLEAVTIGIEVAARMSLATRVPPKSDKDPYRGMSTTYQCGTFGAAMTAAKLLQLDRDQMLNAMGLAFGQAAGTQQGLLEGALSVRVQQGITAKNGILSAQMAELNITGPRNCLEGKFGYYNSFYNGNYDRDIMASNLGKDWEVEKISIKPYPTCKFTHTTLGAALEIAQHEQIDLTQIEKIVLNMSNRIYYGVVCQPLEQKRKPVGERGVVDAQFALPYLVAAALVKKKITFAELNEETRHDEVILELAQKVIPVLDPDVEQKEHILPTPGNVEVHLKNGQVLQKEVKYVKGHYLNPLTDSDLISKFYDCSSFPVNAITNANQTRIVETVLDLESMKDVCQLIPFMTR
ncbi:MmgE/PrpD family protein [Bacillus sp. Marseille-P3661]|uniref:MmgE/PrpD family protein n=1 Tax=Bacillus sp. Marseille-P3661 TaxID=1936234 RepID=UPI000C821A0A|nr:MmgE/PrpD family protein [Bacillus sp. Marseille-P3661]